MSTKMLWRVGGFLSLFALSFGLTSVQGQADNSLPAPTGKYSVGMEWRHWVDESRDETFDQAPHGKREMMVELLYPADVTTNAETAPYIPNRDQVMPAFSQVLTL